MYRKYGEMSLQYILKFKNDSSDPDSPKHENIKKFGHLSNHVRKTRLGSPHLEKTDTKEKANNSKKPSHTYRLWPAL